MKPDDVLFINAAEHFEKCKRQNQFTQEHIDKIVDAYQQRPKNEPRSARWVSMEEIEKSDFNLNISRSVRTAIAAETVIRINPVPLPVSCLNRLAAGRLQASLPRDRLAVADRARRRARGAEICQTD